MKKLILASMVCGCALSMFAQGRVAFNNHVSGNFAQVWGPSSSNPYLSLVGYSPTDVPVGSVDYAGAGMQPVGANGLTGVGGAATTFTQLLAANGANQPESSLTPQGQTTTFRTGSARGVTDGITDTLQGIPKDSPVATFQMVAWDNSSGLYSTWTLASVAWLNGTIAAGKSAVFNVNNIGGDSFNPPNLIGLTSFNIYYVPEPSTFALAGLGAAAMLIFRRRK